MSGAVVCLTWVRMLWWLGADGTASFVIRILCWQLDGQHLLHVNRNCEKVKTDLGISKFASEEGHYVVANWPARYWPELSERCELLLFPIFSLPLLRAASLDGICCWTLPCLCSWLVVLMRWRGTAVLAGRVLQELSRREWTSGRSA